MESYMFTVEYNRPQMGDSYATSKQSKLTVYDVNTRTIIAIFKGKDAVTLYNKLIGGKETMAKDIEQEVVLECLNSKGENVATIRGAEPGLKVSYDSVSHPSHYCEGREYEPRKVIDDWGLDFYLGNCVKYISRAGRKGNRLEDLYKAKQYLEWEIEKYE